METNRINKNQQLKNICTGGIELILTALLVFMPLAFGVVHHTSRLLVIAACSLMFLLFLIKQIFCDGRRFVKTAAYIPLIFFVLLGLFTIAPLQKKTVGTISPQTVQLKTELLGENCPEKMTVSFYKQGTEEQLWLIIAAASCFVIVLNTFETEKQLIRLLKTVAIIGFSIAVIALVQNVFGNGKIYGFINAPRGDNSAGFVNHSHFGQFMNLSIGAAVAVVLLILYKEFEQKDPSVQQIFEYVDSKRAKMLWLFTGIISVSAAAVFASLSRGAMLSMLIAMCIVVLMLSARRAFKQHGWLVVIIALAALVCLLYSGFDAVYERFATLSRLDGYGTRLEILKDMSAPIRKFFIFGTGLGSYAIIYPMFQSIHTALQFSHAENEYAQLLQETGIIGFIAAVSFAVIIAAAFIKAVKGRKEYMSVAVYGLGFGLVAILIHSTTDFGQHLPANMILSAIFCAVIIKIAKQGQYIKLNIPFMILAAAAVCGLYIWTLKGAAKAAEAERYWSKASRLEIQIKQNPTLAQQSDFEQMLDYAEKAVAAQPDNIEYRHWKNVWQWQKIAKMSYADNGLLDSNSMQQTEQIVKDLTEASKICPTFGDVYCLKGQLQKFVLLQPAGEENIKKGIMLEPNSETTLFAAGVLFAAEQDYIKAFENFSKSLSLGNAYFTEIMDIYINQAQRPDLAIELAGNDIGRLKYIKGLLTGEARFVAAEKIAVIVEKKVEDKTATADELSYAGNFYLNNKKYTQAIKFYTLGLEKNYGNADMHFKIALALTKENKQSEAMKHLRVALKLRPEMQKAKKMLAELSLSDEIIRQDVGAEK